MTAPERELDRAAFDPDRDMRAAADAVEAAGPAVRAGAHAQVPAERLPLDAGARAERHLPPRRLRQSLAERFEPDAVVGRAAHDHVGRDQQRILVAKRAADPLVPAGLRQSPRAADPDLPR